MMRQFKIDIALAAGDRPRKDGNDTTEVREIQGEQSQSSSIWLSYELLGKISQSDMFSGSNVPPFETEFRVRCGSWEDLAECLKKKQHDPLCIYICRENSLLGIAHFNLVDALLASKKGGQTGHGGRVVQTCYIETIKAAQTQTEEEEKPYLALSSIKVGLQIQEHGLEETISTTMAITTNKISPSRHGSSTSQHLHIRPPATRMDERDEEKRIQLKQQNYEAWRHRKELEWLQKLQTKEAAMLQAVEEQVASIKNESLLASEASRKEYDQLTARLRKGLMDIESKGRQLKDLELNHQHDFKRRMAELDTRERLNREEVNHFKAVRWGVANAWR